MTKFNCTAGAIALAISMLSAQSAAARDTAATDISDQGSSTAATSAEEETSGIQDIVVTAQRRAENLQNVPIAITALDNDQLTNAGVTSTATLQTAVSGLSFNTSLGANGQPRIRGIGTTANGPGIENPVATYVDGVYYASTATTLMSLADVEQVAVLKGPQGTLFGRNATGGLVQITTRTPTQDFKLKGQVTARNRKGYSGGLYLGGGLSDQLAASVAGYYSRLKQGYGVNSGDGKPTLAHEAFSTRGKIHWEPSADTKVTLSGDYSYYTGSDFASKTLGINQLGEAPTGGPWDLNANYAPKSTSDQGGGSLKIQHEFDGFEVMSLSAYRTAVYTQRFDQDQSAAPSTVFQTDFFIRQTDEQFSQELQLLSSGNGPFKWVLGGIYFWGAGEIQPQTIANSRPAPPSVVTTLSRQTLNSLAGFGQVSYDLSDATTFTAGLRYTTDQRQLALKLTRAPFPGTIADYTGRKRFNKVTWRLALDHRFSPEFLAYASYNRGFKSGAFVPTASVLTEIKPETLDAFEVGFKADLFDRILRVNGSAYYYDYQNTQTTTIALSQIRLFNASGSRHYGFELDTTFQPTDNFNINLGLGFVDAKFKSFPNAVKSFIRPTTLPVPSAGNGGYILAAYDAADPTNATRNFNSVRCFPSGVIGSGTNICDATGNSPQNTPRFTMNLAAEYTINSTMGDFILSGSFYHNSGFFAEVANNSRQPAYNLANLALTWKAPDEKYSVRLWGNNLGNVIYAAQLIESESGNNRVPSPGRSYGLTVGFNF